MTVRFAPGRLPFAMRLIALALFLCLLTPNLLAQTRPYSDGPLKWDDFKGDVPDNTEFSAALAGGIRLANATKNATKSKGSDGVPSNDCILCSKCKPNQSGKRAFKINKKKKKCRVKVEAYIDQGRSWTKPAEQTPELLAHEQGHADIWEAAARAAEKEINCEEKCLPATNCGHLGKNGFRSAINDMVQAAQDKGQEMQEKYDDETDHGRKPEKQKEWEKKIKKLLAIKGGPDWDQFNSLVSTGKNGGNRMANGEHNHPIVPLYFPEMVLTNIPWHEGPLVFVLPSLTFEEHPEGHSRIWALSANPVINMYDEAGNFVATADISAFFGNATDQVFTAELYGTSGPRPQADEQPFPVDPDLEIQEDDRSLLDDETPIFTRLTMTFSAPLGDMLNDLGPYETFSVDFSIGEAPHEPEAADVNYDGAVTVADIAELQRILDGVGVAVLPQTGDLDRDGRITENDLEKLRALLRVSIGEIDPDRIED